MTADHPDTLSRDANPTRVTEQGQAPYPPPGSSERADRTVDQPTPPAPEAVLSSSVSWEERRKGLSAEEAARAVEPGTNPRFVSQQQAVDQPNPHWRPTDEQGELPQTPERQQQPS